MTGAQPGVLLNWGKDRTCKGHHHWGKAARCRICGGTTPLRDCDNRACHKTCAEREATAAAERAFQAATRNRPQPAEHQEAIG